MGAHQLFYSLDFVEGILNRKLGKVFIFFDNGNLDKSSHQELGSFEGFGVATTDEK